MATIIVTRNATEKRPGPEIGRRKRLGENRSRLLRFDVENSILNMWYFCTIQTVSQRNKRFQSNATHLTIISACDILIHDISYGDMKHYGLTLIIFGGPRAAMCGIKWPMREVSGELPLTESTYLILLSLTDERHGYGIMQHVEELSGGRITLGPGTLYGALKSMVKKKWIQELDGDNPRRRCYSLTATGRRILEAEVSRLREMADLGTRAAKSQVKERAGDG